LQKPLERFTLHPNKIGDSYNLPYLTKIFPNPLWRHCATWHGISIVICVMGFSLWAKGEKLKSADIEPRAFPGPRLISPLSTNTDSYLNRAFQILKGIILPYFQ
jgi:hypothetical protein